MLAKEVYFHSAVLSFPSKYLDFKQALAEKNRETGYTYQIKESKSMAIPAKSLR